MPEYSSTTITPADGVQVPSMNGSTSGNILLSALKSYMLSGAGQANGLATLGSDGKLTAAQLPDLADDVIVVTTYANLPSPGTAAKIYITADTNKGYRWDPDLTTPGYVKLFELDKSIVFGYYSSGSFYEDSEHTVQITPVEHVLYVDVSLADIYVLNDGTLIELLGTKWAKITDIQDGTIQAGVATKAWQDILGRAIITTYETKADASDLKAAIRKDEARITNLEEKADPTGAYKTVNYRGDNAVPTGKAKYALVESIVGKSRAWNNLCVNGNFDDTNNWDNYTTRGTLSASSNILTFTVSEIVSASFANRFGQALTLPQGHEVLIVIEFNPPKSGAYYVRLEGSSYPSTSFNATAGAWNTLAVKLTAPASMTKVMFGFDSGSLGYAVNDTIQFRKARFRDLTLIFPEGVPSTVAECVQKCPDILKYDAYGYSMVDTVVEGVKAIGKNLFVPSWGEAQYVTRNADGSFTMTQRESVQSPQFEVKPNTEYTLSAVLSAETRGTIVQLDANGNEIRTKNTSSWSLTETTLENARYMRMNWLPSTGQTIPVTVGNIQIEGGSTATALSEHFESTLSLPTPITLRSAGSVAEVYDLETGEKTNPLGEYTFTGNETLTDRISSFGRVDFNGISSIIKGSTEDVLMVGFEVVGAGSTTTPSTVDRIAVASDGRLLIQIPSQSSVAGYLSYLTGRTIIYALATPDDPTQLTPVIDNTIQTEGGGTINTIQTQTPVIDNSMDVGYLAL